MQKKSPIGYYLRKADELLTEEAGQIHEDMEINRLQWQILDSVSENPGISSQELVENLADFADEKEVRDIIADFAERNFLLEQDPLDLTEQGRDMHRICLDRQMAFRQKVMKDISDQEYEQMIGTLEKMINNLQAPRED